MLRFPDVPTLSTIGSLADVQKFLTVIARKARRALVGSSGSRMITSVAIPPYGAWVMQGAGNDLVITGPALGAEGDYVAVGVRCQRHIVALGDHIDVKSVGEADILINPNDVPAVGDCVYLDPGVPGNFTTVAQAWDPCGTITSIADFATQGVVKAVIRLPQCVSLLG